MIDGYFHLDAGALEPLVDLERRLASAGIERVLVVETWAGTEKPALDDIAARGGNDRHSLAYCFRGQGEDDLAALLEQPAVRAIRARTADLEPCPEWLAQLEQSGRFLLCHGEFGIERLTHALVSVVASHPRLRVYIPHLGWPRQDKRDDSKWTACLHALATLPQVMLGVSALGHFSCDAYPHQDLQSLVSPALQCFGTRRLVAATDYPNLEKSLYAESYHLARQWITECWPNWSDDHALRS